MRDSIPFPSTLKAIAENFSTIIIYISIYEKIDEFWNGQREREWERIITISELANVENN